MRTLLLKRHATYVLLLGLLFCSRVGFAYNSRAEFRELKKVALDPPSALFRINSGGGNSTTTIGGFSADQFYSSPSYNKSANVAIAATTDDALYQSERWGNKNLNYNIPVANGKYKIVLHFAEILFTNPGQRIFDINVEGIKVKDNFDIVAKAGSFTATTETFNSDVTDGVISINLNSETINGGVNNPKISAIEIFALTPPVLASPIADFSAIKGEVFTYTIPANTFLDAENDPLIFSSSLADGSPLPSWLNFNTTTGTFSGTAPLNSPSILAIKVTAEDGNSGSARDEFELKLSEPFSTVLFRINAGGPVINTSIGSFSADQFFTTPSYTKSTSAAIAATTDDNLYRTERWGLKTLNYNVPLASGNYRVILHFAEILHTTAGKRIFDVNIEGNTVLNNYDIVAKAGAFTATTESFIVNVVDGTLNINLSSTAAVGGIDNPKIAAIEVLGLNTVNNPPVVAVPLSDQNAVEGTPFTFTIPSGTFTDPNNDPLTYSATLSDGSSLPQWLSFNGTSNTFSGIPTADSPNTLMIEVTASDGNDSVSDEFEISINHLPVATSDAILILEGAPFNYTPFVDPDGDSLTITYTIYPQEGGYYEMPRYLDWFKYNPATNSFFGAIPADFPYGDNYYFDVVAIADDGKGGITQSSIFVNCELTNAPLILTKPFPNVNAVRGEYGGVIFDVNEYAQDPDAGFWRYNLEASFKMADGSAIPSWVRAEGYWQDEFVFEVLPPADAPDSLLFQITISDNWGDRVTSNFVLYISDAETNTSPVVTNPLIDQSAVEGTPFNFTIPSGTFTDPNNDPLTYSATLPNGSSLPQWLGFNSSSNTFSGIPPADSPNTLTVRVTASDGSDSVSDEFEININHLPVATSDGILILEGAPFNYTPFVDPDGDSLTISYIIYPQEEGGYYEMPRYLDWFKYNPATNSFFGAISADFPYGDNYYFDVVAIADDGKGGITQSSIYVNCELTNAPLILTKPFPNVNAVRGEYGGVIFDVNEYAQDPDAAFWRYNLGASFKMADGSAIPSWVRAEAHWQDEFIFEVLPPADAPDSLLFQVAISDNWGDRVTSNFVLYISDAETNTSNARMALKEKSGIDKVNATASPNPFTNILNIKVEGREDQEYQVKVNDLMGRELYTNTLPITEDLIAINFSKIPNLPHSNLFLITVEDKAKTFRKVLRVIKN